MTASTIGAGDTFIGGALFCHIFASMISEVDYLDFANELAGIKVGQEGFASLRTKIKPEWDLSCWFEPEDGNEVKLKK